MVEQAISFAQIATALAMLSPTIALVGGFLGSALGTALAAMAGVTTLAEDPRQFSRVLALAAMPMTQTFYAFVFMFLVYTLKDVAAIAATEPGKGFIVFGIGLAVAFAEFVSGWRQGAVAADAISFLIKTRGGVFVHGMILAAYEELFGILGLAFGILAVIMWV